jgi:23S rRNA pseudouridine1911/1915/1917 synthase
LHLIREHHVNSITDKIRLINYCEGIFPGLPTKSSLKKAFKRGEIYRNDEPAQSGHWVQSGDRIQWMDLENHPPKPYRLSLTVLHEDQHLIAIDKPAGIPVSGNQFRTLQNAVPNTASPSQEIDALKWPKPAHRLDVPTTGIVLFAKTAKARVVLGNLFETNQIQKTYHAIVVGKLEGTGIIDTPVDGKHALTHFGSLKVITSLRTDFLTLVRLTPKTGRTHQLRIHLSEIGHPIVGDPIYGEDVAIRHKGLFLTASELAFKHPVTAEPLTIKCSIPHKFHSLLERETRRWQKHHM